MDDRGVLSTEHPLAEDESFFGFNPRCPCGRALPMHAVPAVNQRGECVCPECDDEQVAHRAARYGR